MEKSYILAFNQNYTNKEKAYKAIKQNLKFLDGTNSILKDLSSNYLTSYKNAKGLLANIPFSLKDNISTKGITTTGGSQFLKNYIPPFSAIVYEKLLAQNAICISKDNLDEFGLGGTGTFSGFGVVKNILNHERITGGSSSGSANLVKSKAALFAIATDTGDSIRRPASFLGIYGFKPSYGLVSRFGVFPYSPSLDHVGVLSNSVSDIAIVLDAIKGIDVNDYSSIDCKTEFYNNLKANKRAKLCYIENLYEGCNQEVKDHFFKTIENYKKAGFDIEPINFDLKLAKTFDGTYKILSYAEASSCYGNMTGLFFGEKGYGIDFETSIINARTNGFGRQLKRRFIIGEYITKKNNFEKFLVASKKIRTLIIAEFERIFKKYDAILSIGASNVAPKIKDVESLKAKNELIDDYLMGANFAGLPSITIPFTKINNLPLGINITGPLLKDLEVLNIAKALSDFYHEGGNND